MSSIADKKRKENIAEYIIHIYESEELIRTFECDLQQIDEYVLSHLPVEKEERALIKEWYGELMQEMQAEEVVKEGHTQRVQKEVEALTALHHTLLEKEDDYKKLYEEVKPSIDKNMALAEGVITNEIQICLNGVYGFKLLRMRNKKVDPELMKQVDHFGALLSYLAFRFREASK
ncbi:DUF4924 family protein [Algivirga pacifica]|uniref:DUF4924 family protein n=1 Tax=Algivirga pacifica TaxID=1162670 RepID=A0ABP9DEW2_9BACT